MERHEWEAIAMEVARAVDAHTGPLQALDRVLREMGGEGSFAYLSPIDSMERDFWRGWVAWIAPVEQAAYADACVRNVEAYEAGALARMIHDDDDDDVAKPELHATAYVDRRAPGEYESEIEIATRLANLAGLAEEIGGGACSAYNGEPVRASIEFAPSVFECVRCGTESGPHQSCECGANERAPEVVEVGP